MAIFHRPKPTNAADADDVARVLDRIAAGETDVAWSSGSPFGARVAPALRNLQEQLAKQRAETAALAAGLAEMKRKHAAGEIDAVIPAAGLSGTTAAIAADVNELVKAHIDVKMNVVSVVTAYANGDFRVDMDRLPGKKAAVTEAIDRVKAAFSTIKAEHDESQKFVGALAEMTRQHELGWIDECIPVDDFNGGYRRAAQLVNDLVRAHIAVKMQVVGLVTDYANGDFSRDMDRLPGKKAQITDAIDRAKTAFESVNAQILQSEHFIAGLAEMTKQHELGWIDEIIPPENFDGGYRRAAEMVNALVQAHIAVKMKVVELVTKYAHGDFSEAMDRLPGKKAKITEAMDQVRTLLPKPDEIAEMLRIKSALDNATANVMLADAGNVVRYMNRSVTDMLRNAERELQRDLPGFRMERLIGSRIDEFDRDAGHAMRVLADLRDTYKTEIVIGGQTLAIIANPVVDEHGARLGSVVEWRNRTLEVSVERETASIVAAASNGDFSKRLGVEGKDGFFRQLAESINALIETSDIGLNEVVRVLGALAKNDLTETIVNDYRGTFGRLKDDSNATVESLTRTVIDIKEASEIVSTSAREISAGNSDLSQRTEEQASSLEETAASMEQLTATVRQNADNAKQANTLAIGASDIAIKGGHVVGEVVETMAAINASAKKIVDIISVIDGIAFQTNILALNAAVEAARAGEQGRGFAVVAGEVRTLAQRSAAAAKEIKELIGDSVDKTATGSKLVDQAGATMAEIVASVKRVTDIMSAITAASEEQGAGIEQVNEAVAQMDKVTQQNAALVEQVAASAEALEERAQSLVALVSVFRLAGATAGSRAGAAVLPRPAPRPAAARPAPAHKPPRRAAPAVAKPHAAAPDDEGDWSSF